MTNDVGLRDQIEAAIQPWQNSTSKPPCSTGELIVMALVLHNEPLTVHTFLRWLATLFRYYDTLVFASFWEHLHYYHDGRIISRTARWSVDDLKKELRRVLNTSEFPVIKMRDHTGEDRLTISIAAAQIYLAERFGLEQQGTFPFLDLPPELRSIVYTMVASYPKSGLIVRSSGLGKIEIQALTHDFTAPFEMLKFPSPFSRLIVEPGRTVISLLRVNKQIHDEFRSYFFNINTFRFPSISTLLLVIKRIPQSQIQHLRHIAFTYLPHDEGIATKAFKWIASLQRLQRLDVHMDETDWRTQYPGEEPTEISRVPGFSMLRKMRGLEEVNFHGEYANAAAILKSEMELPAKRKKGELAKNEAGAVRKGQRKQPPRAAKAAKKGGR